MVRAAVQAAVQAAVNPAGDLEVGLIPAGDLAVVNLVVVLVPAVQAVGLRLEQRILSTNQAVILAGSVVVIARSAISIDLPQRRVVPLDSTGPHQDTVHHARVDVSKAKAACWWLCDILKV